VPRKAKIGDNTKCRRSVCGKRYVEHIDGLCPDQGGLVFQRHMPRIAASQSFNPDEIAALDMMCSTIMRGGDVSQVTRLPGFPGICRKAQSMRKTVAAKKRERKK
jgi:hypothetical protein